MLGLQLVWSCEMSQASPYLLSLGVSKASMAIVFLAGPLSGLIVQPVVGVLSDRCRSSLGRRRPFIIGGTVASSLAIMLLGWSKDIAAIVTTRASQSHTNLTIALAILAVYVVDFSINVVQAMDRALLVDVVPPSQQPAANAWASRLMGVGAVFGFWMGGIDLVGLTGGWLGDEQLKVLTVFVALFFILAHAVTCGCVTERVLLSRVDEDEGPQSNWKAMRDIWTTLRTLPRPIQYVFNVQFSSWIGWFPILFFATTWVAEIYVRDQGQASDLASAPIQVQEDATRAGTRAMFFHALVSLLASIVMPPLISTPESKSFRQPTTSSSRFVWLDKWRTDVSVSWLTLPVLWMLSNGLFALALLSTYFTTSVAGASFIVALVGVCWAVTQWAPFAILGDLILRIDAPPPSVHVMSESANGQWGTAILSPIDEESSQYTPSMNLKSPSTTAQAQFDKGRLRADSDAKSFDSHPSTPPSVTSSSDYYDTAMDTPDRSTFGDDSPAAPEVSMLAHLPDSPSVAGKFDNETPRPPQRFRAVSSSSSQSPYDLPPNNHLLLSRSSLDQRDPYASTSTLRVDATPRVLQVRHSDDTFDDDSSDGRPSLDDSDRATMKYGGIDSRRGSANSLYSTAPPDAYNRSPAIVLHQDSLDDDGWDAQAEASMILDESESSSGAGERAGVILGCHNIYLVIPQLLVSALSSLIFAIFAPHHTVIGHGPKPVSPIAEPPPISFENATSIVETIVDEGFKFVVRQSDSDRTEEASEQGWDALGLVFRIGGLSALVSTWFCWKLVRSR
ncbi:hypothetical protein ACM66B_002836 [Microbotryomycetes sp. NB124-2]